MRRFALLALSLLLAPPALAAAPCAPVETAPGVRVAPPGCPPARRAGAGPAGGWREDGGGERGVHRFGRTEIRVGGRVRVEVGGGR